MPSLVRNTLLVNTDCSGIEAPLQALRNLGVKYAHLFSCDVDKNVRATIMANFPPEKYLYEDITSRDNTAAPGCDLYVAGFPCQPFSMGGKMQGFQDARGRGTIFFNVLDYIQVHTPKLFILENVTGLLSINGGVYFKAILAALGMVGKYNISYSVLDTKENGIPHSRKRIYICGIRKDVDRGSFSFPEPIERPSIERFLDPRKPKEASNLPPRSQGTALINVRRALASIRRDGADPLKEPFVVDCDSTVKRCGWKHSLSPCITCGRANGHWVTNRGRRFTLPEMLRLQGMDPSTFKVVVSDKQLGKQLGNTMSVNVLERLLARLLPAAGLVSASRLQDRWENGSAVDQLESTRGCGIVRVGDPVRSGRPSGVKRTASKSVSPVRSKRLRIV